MERSCGFGTPSDRFGDEPFGLLQRLDGRTPQREVHERTSREGVGGAGRRVGQLGRLEERELAPVIIKVRVVWYLRDVASIHVEVPGRQRPTSDDERTGTALGKPLRGHLRIVERVNAHSRQALCVLSACDDEIGHAQTVGECLLATRTEKLLAKSALEANIEYERSATSLGGGRD